MKKSIQKIKKIDNNFKLSNEEINKIIKNLDKKIKYSIDLSLQELKIFIRNKFLNHSLLEINLIIIYHTNTYQLKVSAFMYLGEQQITLVLYS